MNATTAPHVTDTTVAGFPALVARANAAAPTTPTVVFLHGAFADHTCFRPWLEPFARAGFDVVAASRRGRLGVGPERAQGLDFDDYVDDTVAVLDTFDRPAILVGHSLGALLAQRIAEHGRAHAIALLAPAPPAMLTAQPIALPRFGPQLPRIMSGRPFIVGNDACSVLALNRVSEPDRPAIHAQLTHESGKVYRALMMGTVRVDASKVTVPVFVAGGDDDRIISTKLTKKTAQHYGTEAHIYEGHGHWLLDEPGSDRIRADTLDWCRSVA